MPSPFPWYALPSPVVFSCHVYLIQIGILPFLPTLSTTSVCPICSALSGARFLEIWTSFLSFTVKGSLREPAEWNPTSQSISMISTISQESLSESFFLSYSIVQPVFLHIKMKFSSNRKFLSYTAPESCICISLNRRLPQLLNSQNTSSIITTFKQEWG